MGITVDEYKQFISQHLEEGNKLQEKECLSLSRQLYDILLKYNVTLLEYITALDVYSRNTEFLRKLSQ